MRIGGDIFKALSQRISGLSTRARWTAGALILLAAAGVTGLLLGGGREWVAVGEKGLSARESASVQAILARYEIPSKTMDGRLLVDRHDIAAARRIISQAGAGQEKPDVSAMEDLARQDDIWRTSDQNDKRWQAAKMATLSKLVEMFPAVASATVIYEPGSPRRLGKSEEPPTAAVRVTMNEGAILSRSTAMAIADLVAGSIAGMTNRNVRVIDSRGQSFRFEDVAGAVDIEMERRRAREAYFYEKIHQALGYIGKVVVGVSAAEGGNEEKGMIVSVAVPESFLHSAGNGGGKAEAAPKQLEEIRLIVARIAGEKADVKVYGYNDSRGREDEEGEQFNVAASSGWMTFAKVAILGALSGGIGWIVSRWRRKSKVGLEEAATAGGAAKGPLETSNAADSATPFEFMDDLSDDEILSLLQNEHPQAIAIVLSRLSPSRAAGVLMLLEGQLQSAVVRRLAGVEQIDPLIVDEVEKAMAQRAAALSPRQGDGIGGEARVAEILRHAGYATERAVLSSLSSQAPSLADSLRRRMFSFEDILQLPPQRIAAALSGVAGEELAVGLRTASEEVKQKILSSLSSEAAKEVVLQMDRIGPVRLIEVEAAQQRIAEAVRRTEMGQYVSGDQDVRKQLLA